MKDQPIINAELGIHPVEDDARSSNAATLFSKDRLIIPADYEQLPLLPCDARAESMSADGRERSVRVFVSHDDADRLRSLLSRTRQAGGSGNGNRADSPTEDRVRTARIRKPPAHGLVSVGSWLLSESAYKRYLEPHIADIYHEYFRAISQGNEHEARKVVFWGYVRALWPLVAAAIRTIRALLRISST